MLSYSLKGKISGVGGTKPAGFEANQLKEIILTPVICKIKNMRERIVRAVAGSFVLLGIALAYFVSPNWIWLVVFVGVNLLQSSFTKFCPLEKILDAAGVDC